MSSSTPNIGLAAAQALAAEITGRGGSAEAVQFDVADPEAAEAALTQLLEQGPV